MTPAIAVAIPVAAAAAFLARVLYAERGRVTSRQELEQLAAQAPARGRERPLVSR